MWLLCGLNDGWEAREETGKVNQGQVEQGPVGNDTISLTVEPMEVFTRSQAWGGLEGSWDTTHALTNQSN